MLTNNETLNIQKTLIKMKHSIKKKRSTLPTADKYETWNKNETIDINKTLINSNHAIKMKTLILTKRS